LQVWNSEVSKNSGSARTRSGEAILEVLGT